MDAIKTKLDNLNSMFGWLEMDDSRLDEIMSRKLSNEVSELLEPALKEYKAELQGDKYYKLIKSEVKLESLFGSIDCFEYDIGNTKVNIILLNLF